MILEKVFQFKKKKAGFLWEHIDKISNQSQDQIFLNNFQNLKIDQFFCVFNNHFNESSDFAKKILKLLAKVKIFFL